MNERNGNDLCTIISRRLGHNQVSTTTNIYAHIMSKADERNAEILDELF